MYNFSILAVAALTYCFIVFDREILAALSGRLVFLTGASYGLLGVYFLFIIVRSIILMKHFKLQRLFYILTIIVSALALFTLAVDKVMFDEISNQYRNGMIFAGEKRMLLVSVFIKFLALVTALLAALRAE